MPFPDQTGASLSRGAVLGAMEFGGAISHAAYGLGFQTTARFLPGHPGGVYVYLSLKGEQSWPSLLELNAYVPTTSVVLGMRRQPDESYKMPQLVQGMFGPGTAGFRQAISSVYVDRRIREILSVVPGNQRQPLVQGVLGSAITATPSVHVDRGIDAILGSAAPRIYEKFLRMVQSEVLRSGLPVETITVSPFEDPEDGTREVVFVLWVRADSNDVSRYWDALGARIQERLGELPNDEANAIFETFSIEVRSISDK